MLEDFSTGLNDKQKKLNLISSWCQSFVARQLVSGATDSCNVSDKDQRGQQCQAG